MFFIRFQVIIIGIAPDKRMLVRRVACHHLVVSFGSVFPHMLRTGVATAYIPAGQTNSLTKWAKWFSSHFSAPGLANVFGTCVYSDIFIRSPPLFVLV